MSELLPCPFCGPGDVRVYEHETKAHVAICDFCNSAGPPENTEAAAIAAWNARACVEHEKSWRETSTKWKFGAEKKAAQALAAMFLVCANERRMAEADALAHAIAALSGRGDAVCDGCSGRGEVGGLRADGYHTDPCPFCPPPPPTAVDALFQLKTLLNVIDGHDVPVAVEAQAAHARAAVKGGGR